MTDYIDRQAALDALERKWAGKAAFDAIKGLPSVQTEIIRCKDCIIHGVCRFEQALGLDGYCSQAERRNDE